MCAEGEIQTRYASNAPTFAVAVHATEGVRSPAAAVGVIESTVGLSSTTKVRPVENAEYVVPSSEVATDQVYVVPDVSCDAAMVAPCVDDATAVSVAVSAPAAVR